MRDFIRGSWKIGAAFAAGAFLLSFLIGLMTGNPFGVVLLRALLLALLFAGLGAGLRHVIRTWLPELSGKPVTSSEPAAEDARGTKVDIVLGDDDAEPGREKFESAEAPTNGFETQPEESDRGGDDESAARAEAAALGELAEELSEDGSVSSVPPFAEETPVEQDLEGDRGDEPAELPGVSEAPEPVSSDSLDSLPDIALQEEFTRGSRSGGTGKRAPAGASGRSPSEAMRENVARQDPATLARALRTVLRKDEKG